MKKTKSKFLGQNWGTWEGGKPIFWVAGEPLPVPSLGEILPIINGEIKKQHDLEYLTFFCKASH